jgi:hypothetical protein
VRLGTENLCGGLGDRQAEHVAAGLLPGCDDGAQRAGLARTGRPDEQADTLWGAEQLAHSFRLVSAEGMLDHRCLKRVALECAAGGFVGDVEQPGLLIQG